MTALIIGVVGFIALWVIIIIVVKNTNFKSAEEPAAEHPGNAFLSLQSDWMGKVLIDDKKPKEFEKTRSGIVLFTLLPKGTHTISLEETLKLPLSRVKK